MEIVINLCFSIVTLLIKRKFSLDISSKLRSVSKLWSSTICFCYVLDQLEDSFKFFLLENSFL